MAKGFEIPLKLSARCDTARGQRRLSCLGIDLTQRRRHRHKLGRGEQRFHSSTILQSVNQVVHPLTRSGSSRAAVDIGGGDFVI